MYITFIITYCVFRAEKLTIPQSGNVYYALSKSQEEVATLLLVKQQSTTL